MTKADFDRWGITVESLENDVVSCYEDIRVLQEKLDFAKDQLATRQRMLEEAKVAFGYDE